MCMICLVVQELLAILFYVVSDSNTLHSHYLLIVTARGVYCVVFTLGWQQWGGDGKTF